jgi:hypothetical protein
MKIFVAALASVLLCACKAYHHSEKDEAKFFEEVEASDPASKPLGKNAATVSIEIGVVIAEMPAELATEIFGKGDWNGTKYGRREAPDLDALANAHAAVEIMSRPKILVRDGATAEVASTNPVAFAKDYEVDEHGEVHEVRGSIEEGVWFEATPKLDLTLELADLGYTIKRTVLERPIAEKSVNLPKAKRSVTVQLPVANTRTSTGHRRLSSGQTVAIDLESLPSGEATKRVTVALISIDFWNP